MSDNFSFMAEAPCLRRPTTSPTPVRQGRPPAETDMLPTPTKVVGLLSFLITMRIISPFSLTGKCFAV
jgi:hypothetical protein